MRVRLDPRSSMSLQLNRAPNCVNCRRQPVSAEGTRKLGTALKRSLESLFGPTLHLTSSVVELTFPTAFERLHVGFYRSKITSWMAAQEEDYRCFCGCGCCAGSEPKHPVRLGLPRTWRPATLHRLLQEVGDSLPMVPESCRVHAQHSRPVEAHGWNWDGPDSAARHVTAQTVACYDTLCCLTRNSQNIQKPDTRD
jgi:hypothetical protein